MPKMIIELDDTLYSSIINHRAKTKYQEHIDYEDLKNAVEDGTVLEECNAKDCIDRSKIGLTDFEILMCDGDYKKGLQLLLDKIDRLPNVYPFKNLYCKTCCQWSEFIEAGGNHE